MRTIKLAMVPVCALALALLCGCDSKTSSNKSSSNSQTANAETSIVDGKTYYAADSIRRFDVAGFNLNTTIAEAEQKLVSDHWNGYLHRMAEEVNAVESDYTMTKDTRTLVLLRNRDLGNEGMHIWGILLEQKFKVEHTCQELAAALIKKYGLPTEKPLQDSGCGEYLWKVHTPKSSSHGPGQGSMIDAFARGADSQDPPHLSVMVDVDKIHFELTDRETMEKQVETVKAAKQNAAQKQIEQKAKSEKVEF